MIPIRMKLSKPQERPLNSADNLHRIAISNLDDTERSLKRWWCNKYRIPPKPLDEYTFEEIFLEHLEDHYEKNPEAVREFHRDQSVQNREEWDGEVSPEAERELQSRWEKINRKNGVTLAKYQTEGDEEMTSEDFQKIFNSLGRKPSEINKAKKFVPGSSKIEVSGSKTKKIVSDDEFEDDY